MKIIKAFAIGDKIPDDAQIIGQHHFVDFKQTKRVAEFYFVVPMHSKRKPTKQDDAEDDTPHFRFG